MSASSKLQQYKIDKPLVRSNQRCCSCSPYHFPLPHITHNNRPPPSFKFFTCKPTHTPSTAISYLLTDFHAQHNTAPISISLLATPAMFFFFFLAPYISLFRTFFFWMHRFIHNVKLYNNYRNVFQIPSILRFLLETLCCYFAISFAACGNLVLFTFSYVLDTCSNILTISSLV